MNFDFDSLNRTKVNDSLNQEQPMKVNLTYFQQGPRFPSWKKNRLPLCCDVFIDLKDIKKGLKTGSLFFYFFITFFGFHYSQFGF